MPGNEGRDISHLSFKQLYPSVLGDPEYSSITRNRDLVGPQTVNEQQNVLYLTNREKPVSCVTRYLKANVDVTSL